MKKEKGRYLQSIRLLKEEVENLSQYPFSLPVFKGMNTLEFHPRVTFIVGENGTGKSTLLEAIAVAMGFNPEGGTINFSFSTRSSHSDLYRYIRPVRGIIKPRDGFFLRAESYYNLATHIEELDKEGAGPRVIDSYGGRSLHEQSHGESFFATFMNRFSGQGLYILDEPEAALSPFRQMAMISRINDLVQNGAQFIIATHSPIIMAYPDALIYQLTADGCEVVEYEQTHHYLVMKEFLTNPGRMLKILMEP